MREMKQIVLDQNLFPKGTDIDSLNVFTKNGAKILREIDFTHRAKSDSTFIVALPGEESGEKLNILFGLFSLTCFFSFFSVSNELGQATRRFQLAETSSLSYAKIGKDVARNLSIDISPLSDLPKLEHTTVLQLWNKCKKIKLPESNEPENVHQEALNRVFDTITPKDLYRVHKNKFIAGAYRPDISLTCVRDVNLHWSNAVLCIELETDISGEKYHHGLGQAITYSCAALSKQPTRDLIFSILVSLREIQIIKRFPHQPHFLPSTNIIRFLDPSSPNPTDGFIALCRILHSSPTTLGYKVNLPESIDFQGKTLPLGSCIGQGAESKVFRIEWEGKDAVAKLLQTDSVQFENELTALEKLKPFDFVPHLLANGQDSSKSCFVLITTPLGESMVSLMSENGFIEAEMCCKFGCDILAQLAQIHSRDCLHGDLRPHNMIVVNGRAQLIDWGLSCSSTHYFEAVFGVKAFVSSRILSAVEMQLPYIYTALDDLESLCYSLFYLMTGQLPWWKVDELQQIVAAREQMHSVFPERLRQFMECLKESPEPNYTALHDILSGLPPRKSPTDPKSPEKPKPIQKCKETLGPNSTRPGEKCNRPLPCQHHSKRK
jgi:tRNA A-37 threonylcarbamoyl transferase component Bud32